MGKTILEKTNSYGFNKCSRVSKSIRYTRSCCYGHGLFPSLDKAFGTLIHLIDRVRMLDNDMIRLDQKIHTIIEIQESRKQVEKDDA